MRVSFKETRLMYTLSPFESPVLSVKPGESFRLEIQDACSCGIQKEEDYRDGRKYPFANPVVGPIFVEGAEAGDMLVVEIVSIEPLTGRGVTYLYEADEMYIASPPIFKYMKSHLPREPRICRIEDGKIHFSEKNTIPYQPMIRTIGVAPQPERESILSNVLPSRHSGNMDLADIAPGKQVFFPVFCKGALLYVGDAHVAHGDGEISGVAIEMPAEVELKDGLIKGESHSWPRIENQEEAMLAVTTTAGRTLEDAIRTAFLELAILMGEKYAINRYAGLMLLSQVGRIRIGNLWAFAAKIEKKYLGSSQ